MRRKKKRSQEKWGEEEGRAKEGEKGRGREEHRREKKRRRGQKSRGDQKKKREGKYIISIDTCTVSMVNSKFTTGACAWVAVCPSDTLMTESMPSLLSGLVWMSKLWVGSPLMME